MKKWKIQHTVLERLTLCFSSYQNLKLNVKLWWAGARERKNRAFFVSFILSKRNFFKFCVLSQFIVYWIHFQDIHTFIQKKALLHTILLLAFKIVESLQCILNYSKIFALRVFIDFHDNLSVDSFKRDRYRQNEVGFDILTIFIYYYLFPQWISNIT